MKDIKIVSFDVEGTLVTTDFSAAIWFEGIPGDYAARHSIPFEQAKQFIFDEYAKVGDQKMEWYDINYWMNHFELGSSDKFLARYRDRVQIFPEVIDVLESLGKKYDLIVASATPREFLTHLLDGLKPYFSEVFSSTSDFKSPKNQDFYAGICRKMNATPHDILHVGDNLQFDYQSASDAGLHAYYLDRRDEQKDHKKSMKTLAGLKDLLLGSR
jgi:HAD superfamily hydrolase (TIGR01549 family)